MIHYYSFSNLSEPTHIKFILKVPSFGRYYEQNANPFIFIVNFKRYES